MKLKYYYHHLKQPILKSFLILKTHHLLEHLGERHSRSFSFRASVIAIANVDRLAVYLLLTYDENEVMLSHFSITYLLGQRVLSSIHLGNNFIIPQLFLEGMSVVVVLVRNGDNDGLSWRQPEWPVGTVRGSEHHHAVNNSPLAAKVFSDNRYETL